MTKDNLKARINDTYIKFFKEKNFLKNAYGEIKTQIVLKEKEVKHELDDSEVETVIETYIKKIEKSIQEFESKNIQSETLDNLKLEVSELSQYVSKALEWNELKVKVQEMIQSGITNVGQFMKELNNLWKVNKKQAKEFFDELTK